MDIVDASEILAILHTQLRALFKNLLSQLVNAAVSEPSKRCFPTKNGRENQLLGHWKW